ncbi:hypothetical protein LADH09A_005223 [Micromonospora sp. LAH09]|uniref:hypothetical protein n=1 Tax=Micromonospora cabrerizensis TaxID=2911213 RepID=UPI001EE9853F|nr:hypothetical protein [Micromonospora cabrerizensis]MCG5471239.1 hypothetical protein [Micromonospora cabrerizensis]
MSRRQIILVALVLLVVGGIGYAGLRTASHRARDQRDLADLTRSSPWPREHLLIPDGVTRPGTVGWLDHGGLDIAYPLRTADGRAVPVLWRLRVPQPATGLPDGVDCDTPRLRTCTDLGGGRTLVVTHQTDNSDPSSALYRTDGARVRAIEVQGPDPVAVEELNAALSRVHPPSDAELLDLLRRDGHQTDWS